METLKLTVAEALMRFLRAQQIDMDGRAEPLFGCVFAIFGHGNVVIVVDIDPSRWSECDCWWDVGLPAQPHSPEHKRAVDDWNQGRALQRRGV